MKAFKLCITALLSLAAADQQYPGEVAAALNLAKNPADVKGKRQSPININTKHFAKNRIITSDPAFNYCYGTLSKVKDMKNVANHSLDIEFEKDAKCKNTFTTSVSKKWYPNDPAMTFKAVQIHFHHGTAHKNKSNMGSEHTYNGVHS